MNAIKKPVAFVIHVCILMKIEGHHSAITSVKNVLLAALMTPLISKFITYNFLLQLEIQNQELKDLNKKYKTELDSLRKRLKITFSPVNGPKHIDRGSTEVSETSHVV